MARSKRQKRRGKTPKTEFQPPRALTDEEHIWDFADYLGELLKRKGISQSELKTRIHNSSVDHWVQGETLPSNHFDPGWTELCAALSLTAAEEQTLRKALQYSRTVAFFSGMKMRMPMSKARRIGDRLWGIFTRPSKRRVQPACTAPIRLNPGDRVELLEISNTTPEWGTGYIAFHDHNGRLLSRRPLYLAPLATLRLISALGHIPPPRPGAPVSYRLALSSNVSTETCDYTFFVLPSGELLQTSRITSIKAKSQFYLPLLVQAYCEFESYIAVSNRDDSSEAVVRIEAFGPPHSWFRRRDLHRAVELAPLPPHGSALYPCRSLGLPSGFIGSARIRSINNIPLISTAIIAPIHMKKGCPEFHIYEATSKQEVRTIVDALMSHAQGHAAEQRSNGDAN